MGRNQATRKRPRHSCNLRGGLVVVGGPSAASAGTGAKCDGNGHGMAQRIIVYWRDIPAQVIVRKGRASERRELPERFIRAIDRTAMRAGARDSDAYLKEWRRGEPEPCGENLAAEAEAAVARLIETYDPERIERLVRAGGFDRPSET
jgi:Virulence factor